MGRGAHSAPKPHTTPLGNHMDWDENIRAFELHQRAANMADRTIEGRSATLRMLASRCPRGPLHVEKIDMLELLARPHARTGEPLSAGTKQVERSTLQVWGKWMLDEGIRAFDPAARLPKVRVPRRRPRPLKLDHIDLMLDGGAYRRTREIITIAALTGLRIGEIVRIRGEDVDWISGSIRSTRKGGLEHVVWMQDDVRQIAHGKPREGWWFPSPYKNSRFPDGGGHVLMKSASDGISRLMRRVGIVDPRITGHSLRHFHATTLLREGAPIRVVQEMLGHASLATTQLYAEVTDDDMASAIQMLPRIGPRATTNRGSERMAA